MKVYQKLGNLTNNYFDFYHTLENFYYVLRRSRRTLDPPLDLNDEINETQIPKTQKQPKKDQNKIKKLFIV